MLYATDVQAQVVSMSLGGMFPKPAAGGANRDIAIFDRVAMYARQRGTQIIAAVGNANTNLDGTWVNLPSDAAGVIGISATTPHDWALNPAGSLDYRAGYSNYGSSAVDFAGPGGDVYRQPDFSQICTIGVVQDIPCFVFDLVLSTGAQDEWGGIAWFWAAGTSMATPHVAGVAALILSEGNVTTPAQLETALRTRATDLGQPGADPFYGAGRARSGY